MAVGVYGKALIYLLFVAACLHADGSISTEGGNITSANVLLALDGAAWHGAYGYVSSLPSPFPQAINATAGNLTSTDLYTGNSTCAYGSENLSLLFSNSTDAIVSLLPGNLSLLDDFIGLERQNGTATFTNTTSFSTGYGIISGVPTTYTEPASGGNFREGYMNDQSGNLVFITLPVSGKTGFNGTPVDFQIILPTMNYSGIIYYVSANFSCRQSPPIPPRPPDPGSYTLPSGNITIFKQPPNVTIPAYEPKAEDLNILRITSFQEVIPGDRIVMSPLIENPTESPILINLHLTGNASALAEPVNNVLISPGARRTIPLNIWIPDDMPKGYYTLLMSISTNDSEIFYPFVLKVLPSYWPNQLDVKRQFMLDYEKGTTLVSLTVTNNGNRSLSQLQIDDKIPMNLLDLFSGQKTNPAIILSASESDSKLEGGSIRWDVQNLQSDESNTLVYRMPILLNDISAYSSWTLAQMTVMDQPGKTSEIVVQDLQAPSLLPGDTGQIKFKLFNSGTTIKDIDVEMIGPQGWKITPTTQSLTLNSRESSSMSISVQAPGNSAPGTYGFTFRIHYGDSYFDRPVFVYVYTPSVEFFAPPIFDQSMAWLGAHATLMAIVAGVITILAGLAYYVYKSVNAPKYSQERLQNMEQIKNMLENDKPNGKTSGQSKANGQKKNKQG